MKTKLVLLAVTLMALFLVSSGYTGEISKLSPEAKVFLHYYLDLSPSDKDIKFSDRENEFDFSRVYAGFKYRMSEDFTARFLTDVGHKEETGQLELFAKYAYLAWDLGFLGAHLAMGLQSTYNWKQPEKMWGYRGIMYAPMESFHKYFEKAKQTYIKLLMERADTLLSTRGNTPSSDEIMEAADLKIQASNCSTAFYSGLGSSADLGISLSLNPVESYYLHIMLRNGGGYKKTENNFHKNFQVRTGCFFLEKALHLTGYFEWEPYKGYDNSTGKTGYNNIHWDAAASYEMKNLFLAGFNVNSKIFSGSYEDITSLCVAGFGNVHIIKKKLKALVRYDHYITGINETRAVPEAPKTNADLIIAGLDFIPLKGINIVPNVQVWTFEDNKEDTDLGLYIHVLYKY
jgi:hypothetical protein